MPELPEVETTCRGLSAKLLGQILHDVNFRRANLRTTLPRPMIPAVRGAKITAITRHSKYALIHLDQGGVIILHLGMSGRMSFMPFGAEPGKHDHVIFHYGSPRQKKWDQLFFNDARRFGVLDYTTKEALAEHKLIAGLGNIYVCEALFLAKVSPERPANQLTMAEVTALVKGIHKVLNAAIAAGGSSLRDYAHTDGNLGYFQTKFKVYGHEGDACPRCKNMIARIVQSGRSSFFCPVCQV
ncbi:MAG TPA: Fpg/Nei family DNA glycosylase [Alphaproteobacteria bacterium]